MVLLRIKGCGRELSSCGLFLVVVRTCGVRNIRGRRERLGLFAEALGSSRRAPSDPCLSSRPVIPKVGSPKVSR